MSPNDNPEQAQPQYRRLLHGPLLLLALVIVVRFVVEAVGFPLQTTRFVSATVMTALVMIYLGALAPRYGVTRYGQLAFVALCLTAWLGGWTALALIVSGAFQLPGSHFAQAPPEPLYPNFGFHVLEHVAIIPVASLVATGIMSIPFALRRWPIIVPPAAVVCGLVALKCAAEAFDVAPTTAAAFSPVLGVLLSGFYLGGVGPRMGVASPREFLVPALALGWVWRLWTFLAALVGAVLGFESQLLDPSQGNVAVRLLVVVGVDVVVVGFAAGLVVWAIAVVTSRVTRPL